VFVPALRRGGAVGVPHLTLFRTRRSDEDYELLSDSPFRTREKTISRYTRILIDRPRRAQKNFFSTENRAEKGRGVSFETPFCFDRPGLP
jgi:hypothetical protein